VGAWVYSYKRVLRIAVIAIAALVLVFWDQPTGKVIIVLALCVLVVLAIIEFLGRPPSPAAPEPPEAETAAATPEVSDAPPTASVAVASSQAHDTSEADVRS
jgi:Na+-transporting methylmalonyl-CoA/oxaloacetate decarboxylase gamma subunit